MPQITFVENDGTENTLDVESGYSLMQVAVDNMLEGIVAECGGACSCATCHCYVDDAWLSKVGTPDSTEEEMIEFAIERKKNSRLSCQIQVTEELDGLVVHLPESQY